MTSAKCEASTLIRARHLPETILISGFPFCLIMTRWAAVSSLKQALAANALCFHWEGIMKGQNH
jgi:hypothetical protein